MILHLNLTVKNENYDGKFEKDFVICCDFCDFHYFI